MKLKQKFYDLLKMFSLNMKGGANSLSIRDIEFIIQCDGSKLNINEIQRLLDKLIELKYIYFDKDRYELEFKGVSVYKCYKISYEGESFLEEFLLNSDFPKHKKLPQKNKKSMAAIAQKIKLWIVSHIGAIIISALGAIVGAYLIYKFVILH